MKTTYTVISRFFDRTAGSYVDPGMPCPPLSDEETLRLVGAGCLQGNVEEESADPPAPLGAAGPAAPPSSPRRRRRGASPASE